MKSDLYATLTACVNGCLSDHTIQWHEGRHGAAVILASEGYPGSYPKGRVITGIEAAERLDGVRVGFAEPCNRQRKKSGGGDIATDSFHNEVFIYCLSRQAETM